MANDLASYTTLVEDILAAAVDSSTWTTAIKSQALRMALQAYDLFPVYEASFTVTVAGHSQDLSAVTTLKQILSVAYPWDGHSTFEDLIAPHRFTAANVLWFEDVEPQINDVIRYRYLKTHTIKDLDAAASTTPPTTDAQAIATYAAGWACHLRARQLSENPAPPAAAIETLDRQSRNFITAARQMLRPMQPAALSWAQIGL